MISKFNPYFMITKDGLVCRDGYGGMRVIAPEDMPQWAKEFPDMDDVPVMCDIVNSKWYGDSTWADTSWHNDVCPSFESGDLLKGRIVKIWSDYRDPALRETEGNQYNISLWSTDGEFIDDLFHTDDKNEVYSWVLEQERKKEAARRHMLKTISFPEMQASRTWCANLYDATGAWNDDLDGRSGFMYIGDTYIELVEATGEYMVTVGNYSETFATLKEAEVELWTRWVRDEVFG